MSMDEKPKKRVLLFTGNGKGKTTAAIGMAVRAAGHGQEVFIIQFIKSDRPTGESKALEKFPNVTIIQTGKGFVPDKNNTAFEEHRAVACIGLERASVALQSGRFDLVCLDEAATAVAMGLIDEEALIRAVNTAPKTVTVVMTGRGATTGLIDLADTVTEMNPIKHGYKVGIKAQKGVEF
jgi:cob(I)alamin adenosyltransferase